MEYPQGISLDFTLGGICAAGVLVSGFLWGAIKSVKRELMFLINKVRGDMNSEQEKMKTSVQKDSIEAKNRVIEAERRFALRADLEALRVHIDQKQDAMFEHINTRFDQLTTLVIQQNRRS